MVLEFIYFLLVITAAFCIPGLLILRFINLAIFPRIILAFIVGMVAWGWQGYVFGFLGVRFLTYLYLLVSIGVFVFFFYRKKINFPKYSIGVQDILIGIIILAGTFIQVSAVYLTGVTTPKGIFFCCGNQSDSIYYAALTQGLVSNFPPFEPGMAGVIVHNYHYWSSIVIADLIRVFKLPLFPTEFQYMALFLSIFLGLTALVLSSFLKLPKVFKMWFVFFLYFGTDLIYLAVSILRQEINFKMSSLENGAIFLVNPPRAFAVVVLFAGLALLVKWFEKKDIRLSVLLGFIFASLIGFKVYNGLFIMSGLGFLTIYSLFKRKFEVLYLFLITVVLSLIVYLPVNSGAGGLYFTGFYIFENFIVQPWLGLIHLEQERGIYLEHNNIPRLIQYGLMYVGFYLICIFGFKILGFFQSKKSLSYIPRELNILLISGMIVCAIIGFFFQQTSGGSNTFNFLVVIFIVSSLYAALACWYWIPKLPKVLSLLLIIFIVIFSFPRIINELKANLENGAKYKAFLVKNEEVQALTFLNKNADKKKLLFAKEENKNEDGVSLYVSVLSQMPIFLSGDQILVSHGIDTSKKKALMKKIENTKNPKELKKILVSNNIGYLYLKDKNLFSTIELKSSILKNVFENKRVKILKVE